MFDPNFIPLGVIVLTPFTLMGILITVSVRQEKKQKAWAELHRTKLPEKEVEHIASAMCKADGFNPSGTPGWKAYESRARMWLGAMKAYEDMHHTHIHGVKVNH